MAKLTREEYQFYKSQDPKDLTQEDLNDINEFESEEAGFPSKEDSDWANFILNESDPQIQRINKESGDYDKAYAILQQQKTARDLMIKEGKNPWIMKVKEVPDDVINGYGFKFNWKSAYENEKGEKLRATENDAEKLRKYIQEKMNAYEDPDSKLKDIAYKMKMTGKVDQALDDKGEMWSRFLESDRFPMFQKYLEDVQKYQKDKEIDRIFNDESNFAVDWMFPVSKEYAKNKIKKGEDPSMAGPMAVDAATQALMFGPGKSLIKNPLLSTIYGTASAPAVMEAGNVMFNDKPLDEAAVGVLEGAMINAAPQGFGKLQNIGAGAVSRNGVGGFTNKQIVQNQINRAADAADAVKMMKKNGYVWSDGKNNYILKKGKVEKISAEEALKRPMISDADRKMAGYGEGRLKKIFGKIDKISAKSEKANADLLETVGKMKELDAKQVVINKLKQGQKPTSQELYVAGIRDKESLANFLKRNLGKAEHITGYVQNMLGRPEFGRRAGASVLNAWFPDIGLFKKKEDKEKGSDKWYRYYGLK